MAEEDLPRTLKNRIEARFKGYTWQEVKASSKRSVYRITRDGFPGVYLKVYHPRDIFQRIRNMVSPRTLKEAEMLKALSLSGIRVPEVLAHFRSGANSAVAMTEIAGSQSLSSFEGHFQEKMLFTVTRDLLDRGFVHDDLHTGNILITGEENYALIDCYEIGKKKVTSQSDRIRFFASAASVFGSGPCDIKMYLPDEKDKDIESMVLLARGMRRKSVGRRIKRSLSNGSFSIKVKDSGFCSIIRRDETIDLNDVINTHRNNLSTGVNILKIQEKTQISVAGGYCVKSYKKPRILRRPYAIDSWKGSLTLMFNGFKTAEPIACVVFDDRSSMFITRKLEFPQLDRLLHGGTLNERQMKDLAVLVGLTLGKMHMLGVFHADLKACNIFIDLEESEVIFIDTDRVTQNSHVSRRKRMRNLIQLGLSIPRLSTISCGKAMIEAYATQTGEDASALSEEIRNNISGKEIVYTTDQGDRFEVF